MTSVFNILFIAFLLMMPPRGRTEPISWDELRSGKFLPRRTQASHQFYLNHLKQLKEENKTTETVILEDVFKRKAGDEQNTATKEKPEYRLIINSFPYWLEPNTVHLLVFSSTANWNREELSLATRKILSKQLPELFDDNRYKYVIHINRPENRTVRGLAHSHIFIRDDAQPSKVFSLIRNIPFSRPGLTPPGWK